MGQAKPARDLERDLVMAGIASIWSERTFHTGELNSRALKDKGPVICWANSFYQPSFAV
jgi:hypothetical protein